MSVGIQVGNIIDEIGTPDFLNAFFSTVSVNLEPGGWGSRFPLLLGNLYRGQLNAVNATQAVDELQLVRAELSKLPPSAVIWDADNRAVNPPWGDKISDEITSLGNYFVSSTGRDLFDLLHEALAASAESAQPARIVQY